MHSLRHTRSTQNLKLYNKQPLSSHKPHPIKNISTIVKPDSPRRTTSYSLSSSPPSSPTIIKGADEGKKEHSPQSKWKRGGKIEWTGGEVAQKGSLKSLRRNRSGRRRGKLSLNLFSRSSSPSKSPRSNLSFSMYDDDDERVHLPPRPSAPFPERDWFGDGRSGRSDSAPTSFALPASNRVSSLLSLAREKLSPKSNPVSSLSKKDKKVPQEGEIASISQQADEFWRARLQKHSFAPYLYSKTTCITWPELMAKLDALAPFKYMQELDRLESPGSSSPTSLNPKAPFLWFADKLTVTRIVATRPLHVLEVYVQAGSKVSMSQPLIKVAEVGGNREAREWTIFTQQSMATLAFVYVQPGQTLSVGKSLVSYFVDQRWMQNDLLTASPVRTSQEMALVDFYSNNLEHKEDGLDDQSISHENSIVDTLEDLRASPSISSRSLATESSRNSSSSVVDATPSPSLSPSTSPSSSEININNSDTLSVTTSPPMYPEFYVASLPSTPKHHK